jgi:hypothetical protein
MDCLDQGKTNEGAEESEEGESIHGRIGILLVKNMIWNFFCRHIQSIQGDFGSA